MTDHTPTYKGVLPWFHPDAMRAREAAAMVFTALTSAPSLTPYQRLLRTMLPPTQREIELVVKFKRLAMEAYEASEEWHGTPGPLPRVFL